MKKIRKIIRADVFVHIRVCIVYLSASHALKISSIVLLDAVEKNNLRYPYITVRENEKRNQGTESWFIHH